MAYTAEGIDQKAEVLIDAVDTVRFYLKRDGALINPDLASVYATVKDPNGTTVVERTQVGVTQAVTGVLTYTRTWADDDYDLAEDYVVDWEWQESAVVHTDRQFFDVVKTKLPCLIDTNDLQEFYPDIEEHLLAVGESNPLKFIKRGWSHMLDNLRSNGSRPSLILDRGRLVNPGTRVSLAFACDALVREVGDLWDVRSAKHMKAYADLMAGLGELKYDRDEDALPEKGETVAPARKRWSV